MTIGERILQAAKVAGVTQMVLAEHLGIKQASISSWGKGKAPKVDKISTIANFLGVSEEWLLTGTINQHHARDIRHVFMMVGEIVDGEVNHAPTYEKVAKKLGVSAAFIQAIEEGKISPNAEFFDRLMRDGLMFEPSPDGFWEDHDAKAKALHDERKMAAAGINLQEKISRQEQTIDHLNAYISLLEAKIRGYEDSRD